MNNQLNNYNQHGVPITSYYQPQFGTPQVYATQGSNLNHAIVQPNPASRLAHRSPWLLVFGIIDVIMSGIIFVWCIFVMPGWTATVYLASSCGVFHIILGALSITGSRDGVRYRGCIIASLVMSIVGPCAILLATMSSSAIELGEMTLQCAYCLNETDCPRYCYLNNHLIFGGIIIYTLLQGIVCIVTSGIACCNLCYSCGCCYTGETPSHTLIYTGSLPPYVALEVPRDVPTSSDGVAEPTPPNDNVKF